jgi:uncharacterized protein with FMN-binding domain
MYPEEPSNRNQKAIASALIVLTVVLVAVVVTIMNKKEAPSDQVAQTTKPETTSATTGTDSTTSTASNNGSTYKDGIYTATDGYTSPGGRETITVTVTLKDGTVTNSTVRQEANNDDSAEYQAAFRGGYKPLVTGKKIDAIQLSRVSGSSLTSRGFNAALEQIKTQASSQS